MPDWREDDVETLLHTWGEDIQRSNKKFKVAIFSCAPYDREWFDRTNEELGSNMEFTYNTEQLNIDTVKLAEGCDAVCTFVNDFAGADVVEALHQLGVQMIALRCAGFDRVDLKAAEQFGITVARVPAYSPYAVGEHAVALMLSLILGCVTLCHDVCDVTNCPIPRNRQIARSYRNSRMGNFSLNGAMIGQTLHGKRVGIIGTGLIGSITARVMKTLGRGQTEENPKIKDPEPQGLAIPYVSLDELLSTSLIQGLKDGTIGGAAMDVVENEAPYFFRNFSTSWITDENIAVLLRMPNEALKTISDTSLKSMAGVREGSGPPKQNGKLDCVCLPPKQEPSVQRKETQAAAMSFMQSLPPPVHPMKAEYFPAFENADHTFRIAFFSATPTEIEAFQKGNEEFKGNFTIDFYKSRLTMESVDLVKGAQAVCIFAPPNGLGLRYVSLDEIFTQSDIICLFVPLNGKTTKLIDAAAIEKMKNGVILVNTSRGGLIDNKALIQGLQQGKIGGAGLDVVEGEDAYFHTDWSNKVDAWPEDQFLEQSSVEHDDLSVLTCFNNVVVTYHQAWFTVESMKSLCHTTLRSFHACRLGEEPPLQRNKYKTVVSKQDGDCTASIDFMSFRRSKKEIESA
eukprot:g33312.t1